MIATNVKRNIMFSVLGLVMYLNVLDISVVDSQSQWIRR